VKRLTVLLAALGALLLVSASPALASELEFKETFGSAEQPAFAAAYSMAVDQSNGDLYVLDKGGNEKQRVPLSGFTEGDTFSLGNLPASCSSSTTGAISYSSTSATTFENMLNALGAVCGGTANFKVSGNLSEPIVEFKGTFVQEPQPLMSCTVETGGGSCSAAFRNAGGHQAGLYRYKENGEADNFSALGTNRIAATLSFFPQEVQVAVDDSGGATDGNIYLALGSLTNAVKIYGSDGEAHGELTESSEGAFAGGIEGVAVDSSGAVYAAESGASGHVHKYVPAGSYPVNGDNTLNFAEGIDTNLAAGSGPSAGALFVRSAGLVKKFDASSGAEDYEAFGGSSTSISVDPVSGYLYVNGGSATVTAIDASGASPVTVSSTVLPVSASAQGIAVDGSTGDVYTTQTNHAEVSVFSQPEEEGEAKNRVALTITKSPDPSTGEGQGSVQSKPKGIKCGYYCTEAVAQMYLETPVELKEKPGKESSFVEWSNPGGPCDESTAEICTVPMAEDESVEAVFTGTSKIFSPAVGLTVEKAGDGEGTVKGTGGLGCEALCSSTEVLYQGPITEPKPKPGKKVTLKQSPAFGSAFVGWTGCSEELEGSCIVFMEEDLTVTAEYEALPSLALTVNKTYATGNGQVQSKPKGIKCGYYCTQAVAQMPEGSEIELKAKPGKETTFEGWVGGDCEGSTELVCIVTMDEAETTEAVFSKPSKALKEESAATLTVTKAGSGFGTVKGTAGLGCEWLCTSTDVVYQGPVALPKPKPGKTVVLRSFPAPGSGAVEWTGCTPISASECEVTMEEDTEVTATFEELE
jgi:Divergent InlB B-repeat domain